MRENSQLIGKLVQTHLADFKRLEAEIVKPETKGRVLNAESKGIRKKAERVENCLVSNIYFLNYGKLLMIS